MRNKKEKGLVDVGEGRLGFRRNQSGIIKKMIVFSSIII
jgi:hypothetical protein